MSHDRTAWDEGGHAQESRGEYLAGDVVEVRVPARTEFLTVLRAVVAVVAGGMSFNYDEIVQLRVAVSEAFGLAVRHMRRGDVSGETDGVTATFVMGAGGLEVVVTDPGFISGETESAEDAESRAVLESLMDSVELGAETSGQKVIRLAKHRLSVEDA